MEIIKPKSLEEFIQIFDSYYNSGTSNEILESHYIEQEDLSGVEKAVLKLKVFG